MILYPRDFAVCGGASLYFILRPVHMEFDRSFPQFDTLQFTFNISQRADNPDCSRSLTPQSISLEHGPDLSYLPLLKFVEDVLHEGDRLAVDRAAEERLREDDVVEADSGPNVSAIGDEEIDVEAEIRGPGIVLLPRLLVVLASEGLAVVGQLVVNEVGEVGDATGVEAVDVAPVLSLEVGCHLLSFRMETAL